MTFLRTKRYTPAIVTRHARPIDDKLMDIVSIRAFEWGVAQPAHFNRINDIMNFMYIGVHMAKADKQHKYFFEEKLLKVLQRIKDRSESTGKLSATLDECALLRLFYNKSEAFWAGQSGRTLEHTTLEFMRYKAQLAKDKEIQNGNKSGTSGHIQGQTA